MRLRRIAAVLALALSASCLEKEIPYTKEELLLRAAKSGSTGAIKDLLDRGADIETRNPGDGWTPLMWAAVRERPEAVRLLAARGAKLEACDRKGLTALMVAARWGRQIGVEALIEAGAKVDARDINGWTALMWVSFKGNARMVRLLLDRGASPNARDGDGRSPLSLAEMKDHGDAAALLRSRGATASLAR